MHESEARRVITTTAASNTALQLEVTHSNGSVTYFQFYVNLLLTLLDNVVVV